MSIVIRPLEKSDYSYKDVVSLLHDSFQERLEQGLRYTCSSITEEQYREKTKKGIVLVASDEQSEELVGTMVLNFLDNKSERCGYTEYLAIRNDVKATGIGSLLFKNIENLAIERGCPYLLSDTSVLATSAVKWHLRNGFKIVGLESYRSTNYWSYVFRKQLVPSKKWDNDLYCRLRYYLSWIFIRLTRDIYGNDTIIGRLYKSIKNRW